MQAVTLPNDLFGSLYIVSLRISDCSLSKHEWIDMYLSSLFHEFDMRISGANNQYSAVYRDCVFPQLTAIVARYSNGASE